MPDQRKRVVILGAGFGGLFAAKQFCKLSRHAPGMEVTLLDKNNYHMFVPLLYVAATGGVDPMNICFPIRATLKNGGMGPPVMFRECEVLGVEMEKKKVITNRAEFEYDYLLFALGSTTNFYGIPGVEQHIMAIKSIGDGMAIHSRILESFEAALMEPDGEKRREMLTFCIVGGGPTGVELACMIALFVFKILARDFPPLVPLSRVVLIEAGDSLLRGMNPELGRLTLERLKNLGVEVVLNCSVASATVNCINTKDGRTINSKNVIWSAGVKPSPVAQKLQVEKARDGRIIVDDKLQAPSAPDLYVVGDCAYVLRKDTGKPYPPTAQVAVQEGIAAARNIVRAITNQPLSPFNYKYKGDMVFLGRNYGVAEIRGRVISGVLAFWIYQVYHLMSLTGFKNKIFTFIDWAYDYFYRRNTIKLS